MADLTSMLSSFRISIFKFKSLNAEGLLLRDFSLSVVSSLFSVYGGGNNSDPGERRIFSLRLRREPVQHVSQRSDLKGQPGQHHRQGHGQQLPAGHPGQTQPGNRIYLHFISPNRGNHGNYEGCLGCYHDFSYRDPIGGHESQCFLFPVCLRLTQLASLMKFCRSLAPPPAPPPPVTSASGV